MTKRVYKPTFEVPWMERDGRKRSQEIAVRCRDEDYFFYTLLTKGFRRGIIQGSAALNAEVDFFYNGYSWADTTKEAEQRVG